MWIGNALLAILYLPLVGLWLTMLKIPYRWLFSIILVLSCIGVFSVNNDWNDVIFAASFGLLGDIFVKLDCEPAPLILGFVLGPMFEENFRRAMLLSRGDFGVFVQHPISAAFLLITVAIIVSMIFPAVRRRKEGAVQKEE